MSSRKQHSEIETTSKDLALKHFFKGNTVWYVYSDGCGSKAETINDIIEHDKDGYFMIETERKCKLKLHTA